MVKPKQPEPRTPDRSDLARLLESGDLFRVLVDRVADYAIFALDPAGVILTWNTGGSRLEGYESDEVIGKHFSMFYLPEDRAIDKPGRELEIAKRDGRVEDEGWRVRKDGTRFWANVIITALRDETGKLLGFGKVARDLTDRVKAEEQLRESEERARLMVQAVKDYAIFMLDPKGIVRTWNTGAQRTKGYSADEIIGKHFSTFYGEEDRRAHHPERELEIAARTGVYEEEGWRIRKDGGRFWASVVITAVRDPHGDLIGFVKVTRDLTERRAAQERAIADARLLAQAEAANRTKSEFLAAMSHELRTPLNAIGGYAQLMQLGVSGPVSPDQLDHLERIQRSQQHLLGIINDILNFSRVEAGQVEYEIQSVPLRRAIEAVAPMVTPQAQAKNLTVQITHAGKAVTARADESKVEQILLNLLSNAVKFTADGGHIELSYGTAKDHAWIAVRDTGIGIPASDLESIFAPFVQVGRSLATPKEGTGLGLAISRDLARAMKGDVTVESTPGAGATFTLKLPRTDGAKSSP